jgi:hypothetical protein
MHHCCERIAEPAAPARSARVVRSAGLYTPHRRPAHSSAGLVGGSAEPGRAGTRVEAARVRQAQRLLGNQAAQRLVQRFVSQSAGAAPAANTPSCVPAHVPQRIPASRSEIAPPASHKLGAELPSDLGSTPAPPEGLISPPSDEAIIAAGAPADDQATAAPQTTVQISGGPESSLKAVARAEAQLISSDAARSEIQILRIATAHRQQIGGQFGGVRRGLSTLFAQSSAGIRSFVASRQAEVRAASAGLLKSAQALVTGTVQAAQAQANAARAAIDGFVASVTASQGKVQEIAAQIGGWVTRLPVPDLPVVAQLRAAAARLVGSAAEAVTDGLAQVRGLIASALQAGMQLLRLALADLQQLANVGLARVAAAVQRGAQALLQSLGQIAGRVIAALRTLLSGTVVPMVNRLEGQTVTALRTVQQQAVAAIRSNRDQHLQALAAALNPRAGGANAPAKGTSEGDPAAALREIGQEAVQNDRMIVQTFDERTGSILGSIFQALTGGAGRIAQQIGNAIAEAT